jgi:hypothetical protein
LTAFNTSPLVELGTDELSATEDCVFDGNNLLIEYAIPATTQIINISRGIGFNDILIL